VIHRFHPLFGRDFEFVVHRRNWGEDRVYCRAEDGGLRSEPPSLLRTVINSRPATELGAPPRARVSN
jgi:hypothetical protein